MQKSMDPQAEYISQAKYDALKDELTELTTTRRTEIAQSLEYARSFGDLSENAEYHQAREQQGKNEARISEIEYILKNAVIVSEKHTGGTVGIGATVVIKKSDGTERTIEIVGSEDADMATGKISLHSPIGQALFGKKKGDTAEIKTPSGTKVTYTITSVK